MITICFVAFTVTGTGQEVVYMLPNCDPKHTGNMTCEIQQASDYARPYAVCIDNKTKQIVYSGFTERQKET